MRNLLSQLLYSWEVDGEELFKHSQFLSSQLARRIYRAWKLHFLTDAFRYMPAWVTIDNGIAIHRSRRGLWLREEQCIFENTRHHQDPQQQDRRLSDNDEQRESEELKREIAEEKQIDEWILPGLSLVSPCS